MGESIHDILIGNIVAVESAILHVDASAAKHEQGYVAQALVVVHVGTGDQLIRRYIRR